MKLGGTKHKEFKMDVTGWEEYDYYEREWMPGIFNPIGPFAPTNLPRLPNGKYEFEIRGKVIEAFTWYHADYLWHQRHAMCSVPCSNQEGYHLGTSRFHIRHYRRRLRCQDVTKAQGLRVAPDDTGYLGYEAAEGLDWVWEHRIDDLAQLGI